MTKNKLGIIVFSNHSGLGNQTRRLCYMLKPHRILAIDSTSFSKNKQINLHWYDNFTGYKVSGFPSNREIRVFLTGLTHVIVCENPLNFSLLTYAKQMGIKVYIQSNYEFCDHLDKDIDLPYAFLMPSYWKLEEMRQKFPNTIVEYLPPPIDPNEFKTARHNNFSRNKHNIRRYLHIVGTLAVNDRNGTQDLLESLKYTDSRFELVIKSQHPLPDEYLIRDSRLLYKIDDEPNQEMLYSDFDALILPRRYGGLSLTTNEALMSGLPVIMPDISPNYRILPKKWLVPSRWKLSFKTRTMINVFEVDPKELAKKIDWLSVQDIESLKTEAFEIGYNEFSESKLLPKYSELLS